MTLPTSEQCWDCTPPDPVADLESFYSMMKMGLTIEPMPQYKYTRRIDDVTNKRTMGSDLG